MLARKSIVAVLAFIVLAPAAPTHADNVTFEFWKAAMTIEVQVPGPGGAIVKRKLKTNDVINLALGRPLTTKPDKKVEILALAGDASTPGLESQVVVFNPTTRAIVATIWTLSNFALLNNPDFSLNYVTADASFVATTLGTPAQDGFLATTIAIAGTGKHGGSGSLSVSSTAMSGPVSFRAGGTAVSGLMLKGKFKTGGASLGASF